MNKKITKLACFFLAFCALLMTDCAAKTVLKIDSITRQDPNNAVLQWTSNEDTEYEIYRSNEADGEYKLIGKTNSGSFRDDTADYPENYYYKIKANTIISEPVPINTNPQKVYSVSVIMYHNFIGETDINSGVEFDEYSITPEEFENDLIWLRDNGYVTITSEELIDFLEGKKSLPEKTVILSIDDGTWGVYKNAWPILKKYNMKADFNLIGQNIDDTWDKLNNGGLREGESAPYCTWEEIAQMSESGVINICSHSYGLHRYNKDKRIGMQIMDNEAESEYAKVIKKDYDLMEKCIYGWIGKKPETVAYPYSKRSDTSDRVILENSGYKILMAGANDRGTASNYFVYGCDFENQLRLMSRSCRMEGTPISVYLENMQKSDFSNGVNSESLTQNLSHDASKVIANDYLIFNDATGDKWFSGSVYYAYLNGLMKGTSYTTFSPDIEISRAMAATLLYRTAGSPAVNVNLRLSDVSAGVWFENAAFWSEENNILSKCSDGRFRPDDTLNREELSSAIFKCASYLGMNTATTSEVLNFSDSDQILEENMQAVEWVVANGILRGNQDGTFNPNGNVTRAQMATILQNWFNKFTI